LRKSSRAFVGAAAPELTPKSLGNFCLADTRKDGRVIRGGTEMRDFLPIAGKRKSHVPYQVEGFGMRGRFFEHELLRRFNQPCGEPEAITFADKVLEGGVAQKERVDAGSVLRNRVDEVVEREVLREEKVRDGGRCGEELGEIGGLVKGVLEADEVVERRRSGRRAPNLLK
jgi:hypothetical protein